MAEQFVLRNTTGQEFPVSGVVHIGREASNTIALNDTATSRHHASVWVEKGTLFILDDKSANGVLVNGKRISATNPKALRNGDKVLIGQTTLIVGATHSASDGTAILPTPAAGGNSRWLLIGCSVLVVLLGLALVTGAIGLYMLDWQLPFGQPVANAPTFTPIGTAPQPSAATPAVTLIPTVINLNATVLSVSTPPPLLGPQQFADRSKELAGSIAVLNMSQLDFIKFANENPSGGLTSFGVLARPFFFRPQADELDDKLLKVAADALHVAALADSLSQTAVAQEGGSANAEQLASQYQSIAQVTAALVIEVQNWRDGLAAGQITPQEVALAIADYGGRLWNSDVVNPAATGNPFLAGASADIPAPTTISAGDVNTLLNVGSGLPPFWMAFSGESETKILTLPPAKSPPVDVNDPATVTMLTTVEGQKAAPDAARQLAAAIIDAGGGADIANDQLTGGEVVAAYASAAAVSAPATDPATTPPRTLPTFPGGKAATVIQPSNSPNPVTTLFGIDNNGAPTAVGQLEITETQPVVSLTISNLVIKQINKRPKDSFNTFEADVIYEFDVQWAVNLTSPQFSLDCVSGNHFEITSASGSQHINAKGLLILYPGAEDAYCYASRNGNTLGSASVHFLVGDAAEATQRAEQVETDSASLDLTLTADDLGTKKAQATQAAATQGSIATSNAVATEVYGTQTAEFRATITTIARQTELAPTPTLTFTPLPTATFVPVVVDTTFHAGNIFAVNTNVVLQPGRLYSICLSGTVNLTTGPVRPSDIDSVNGIAVPASGCVVIEGNGAVATIACGSGEPDPENPGGFVVIVTDLGPS